MRPMDETLPLRLASAPDLWAARCLAAATRLPPMAATTAARVTPTGLTGITGPITGTATIVTGTVNSSTPAAVRSRTPAAFVAGAIPNHSLPGHRPPDILPANEPAANR